MSIKNSFSSLFNKVFDIVGYLALDEIFIEKVSYKAGHPYCYNFSYQPWYYASEKKYD